MKKAWITSFVFMMIVSAVTASATNRVTGVATGNISFNYWTDAGSAFSTLDIVWEPLYVDFGTDKSFIVRIEAPPGQAFVISTSRVDQVSLGCHLSTDDLFSEPMFLGPGEGWADMLIGPVPTTSPMTVFRYSPCFEKFRCSGFVDFPADIPIDIAFTAMEVTYTIPAECQLVYAGFVRYAGDMISWAITDNDPGEWISIEDKPTQTQALSWSEVKKLYR